MAKTAISFMKKAGEGYIKLWKAKVNGNSEVRQLWTDKRILVLDGFGYDQFNFPAGTYLFEKETGLIVPGDPPFNLKLKAILPKMKGYRKAEVVRDYGLLRLSQKDGKLIVTLKGKGVMAFLDYEYYHYLTMPTYMPENLAWKVKSGEDPVLFFWEKDLRGMVMPINIET